jgi:hypothetical protein
MEKSILDKYLNNQDSLPNWYNELKEEIKKGGFLESLANVLVNGQSELLKFRIVHFHGKEH